LLKLFDLSWKEMLFYAIVLTVIIALAYPQLFSDTYEEKIAPAVDKLAMGWLQDRGLDWKEEELDAKPIGTSN
jgi:hypothetical protein